MRSRLVLLFPLAVLASEIRVETGGASFIATTNVSAIAVHGKSGRLQAQGSIRAEGDRLIVERVSASVDAATLTTGLGIRDRHMREKILATPEGGMPELRFEAENAVCRVPSSGQSACELEGTFSLRGQAKPFRMSLALRPEGKSGAAWRVAGQGSLRLSDYGIEPPSQLGVRVEDSVAIKVDFVLRANEVRAGK